MQTIGSAGESIASGVVFTLPALLFLSGGEQYFQYLQIMVLAAVGGALGVLMMVPLRRSLIVKEHANLPYPEGTACADVLIVGEKGGNLAKRVFAGVYIAIAYKLLMSVLGLWKDVPSLRTSATAAFPNAVLDSEITPEYLGVGYIIGPAHRVGDVLRRRPLVARAHPAHLALRARGAARRPTCTPSASATPGSRTTTSPSRSTARTSATSAPARSRARA